jgi:prepilin-type N-terminal cleavage/methylation domain-containing protein/prepilin-type processing-associated H-X9-DG protein
MRHRIGRSMNRHWASQGSRAQGFTLIELLIVIAIIVLLAALLFPVFARARENARRASCLSNMKQMGLALQQYTQDYDEKMPVTTSYITYNFMDSNAGNTSDAATAGDTTNLLNVLFPYAKSAKIYVCPSASPYVDDPSCTVNCQAPTATSSTSYIGNANVIANLNSTGIPPRSLSSIPNTAEIIVCQERLNSFSVIAMYPRYDKATAAYIHWHLYNSPSSGLEGASSIHFDGGNLLFCDGHAKWRKYTSLSSSEFGLTPKQAWSPTNQADPDGSATKYTSVLR